MNGKELRSFSHYQIWTKIAYPDLSIKLENWLILKFVFNHFKIVKISQSDQTELSTWFTSVFLMNGKELRSFSPYQILISIAYTDHSRNLENWLILKFVFIHCKTVKISPNHQIQLCTWFASVFLMNGKELRNFHYHQILT